MEILASVSIVVSCVVTIVHAVIAYKKSKEPARDPVWDAALAIVTSAQSGCCDADEFAQTYENLAYFKNNGCSLHGKTSIAGMRKEITQSKSE